MDVQTCEWTAARQTFEATVGIGGEATQDTVDALMAAFASMRFADAEGSPESVVIPTGTAAGEDWELIARRASGGLDISLESGTKRLGDGCPRPR